MKRLHLIKNLGVHVKFATRLKNKWNPNYWLFGQSNLSYDLPFDGSWAESVSLTRILGETVGPIAVRPES
jgi:hypothetical protein